MASQSDKSVLGMPVGLPEQPLLPTRAFEHAFTPSDSKCIKNASRASFECWTSDVLMNLAAVELIVLEIVANKNFHPRDSSSTS